MQRLLTQISSSSSLAAECVAAIQPHQIMRQGVESHPACHNASESRPRIMACLLMFRSSSWAAQMKRTRIISNSSSEVTGRCSRSLLQDLAGTTSRQSHHLMRQQQQQQQQPLLRQALSGCAASPL
jgi:hypothetical protein